MRFKKKDIFITKQLSEADIKTTLLPKLNDIQSKTNYTVKYFLNIIDIFRRKYYVLVDDETKNSYGLGDNLVDLSYLDSGLDNKITKVKTSLESEIAKLKTQIGTIPADLRKEIDAMKTNISINKTNIDNNIPRLDNLIIKVHDISTRLAAIERKLGI